MRVGLDVTFARRAGAGAYSGTTVYLQRLVPALRRAGVEVVELADEGRPPPGGGGWRSARNLVRDAVWVHAGLPRLAARAQVDVLHHPLPARALVTTLPQVVTVHDLAFESLPEAFDPRFRRWAQRSHRAAARGADAVVAVSSATRAELLERWEVDPDRVVVARHGPGQEPDATRPSSQPPGHFLYVGDNEPRKNLPLLLDAYARYRSAADDPLPLVLAGSARSRAPGVRVAERPAPDTLAGLYAGAAALVHPAVHEGFGLTPLEAMTAGTPVVAVRNPAVEETCGDAALYVGARDAAPLADQLAALASDARLRAELRLRGRRRAAEFSWARSARAHIAAYTLALERRTG